MKRFLNLFVIVLAIAAVVLAACQARTDRSSAPMSSTPSAGPLQPVSGGNSSDNGRQRNNELSHIPSADHVDIHSIDLPIEDEKSKPDMIKMDEVAIEQFDNEEETDVVRGREEATASSEMGGTMFKAIGAGGGAAGLMGQSDAPRQVAKADTYDDRDLGKGAGDEKLGDPVAPKPEPSSSERFNDVRDNPFVRVAEKGGDASTFAVDVDTASYSNVRRYISQERRLPPKAAVRIEELINYFPYSYPAPAANAQHPFAFATAVTSCPWEPTHQLVRVALKGKVLDRSTRPALNLVFLVDTSGSMLNANKLPLVKKTLSLLVDQLDERDRIALVTYAGNYSTPLAATAGDQHDTIRAAINALGSGGGTNGSGGIEAAYAEATKGHHDGVQSRVMLCTDGDFNIGVSDTSGLTTLIEGKRSSGIYLSVYGFGMGNYQDANLEALADKGNGVYGYIDDEREARKIMVDEALGSTVTIAKDVKIQVFFNPTTVAGWRLIGYENRMLRREDFNNDAIDAGEIGAGHTVTALYEIVPAGIEVPAAAASDPNPFTSDYADEEVGIATNTLMRLRLRYQPPTGGASILQEQDIGIASAAMDDDFKTAAGCALYGMCLRESPYKGTGTWSQAAQLVGTGLGNDANGLRAELVGLIGQAQGMRR